MSLSGRHYWLVGASEGLGRALATELSQRGAHLTVSARAAGRLKDLAQSLETDVRVLPIDVTDPDAVATAFDKVGDIDGLIYLAGYYEPMTAEDWDPAAVEAMFNVNLMGAVRVLGHVVPTFAKKGSGHVVITGSLSGYRGLPGAIGYGASKSGLMHLAENLRSDLWHSGVQVQLINPGFIKTRLTDKNDFNMPFILTPEDAAKRFADAMESRRFKTDFPWGFSLVFRASGWLPQWAYERLFARAK